MSKLNNQGSGTKPLSPDPDSNRSKKRSKRGFQGLERSVRKHRRNAKRTYSNPSGDGAYMQPGKNRYHATK